MPQRVKFNASRAILAAIWGLFFLLNLGVIFYLYFDHWIEKDSFDAAIAQISSSYVTYLGVIITFYLVTTVQKKKTQASEMSSLVVAIIRSLIWNVVISSFIMRLVFGSGTIEESIKQVESLSKLFNWVVAPVMGFYFAQTASAK